MADSTGTILWLLSNSHFQLSWATTVRPLPNKLLRTILTIVTILVVIIVIVAIREIVGIVIEITKVIVVMESWAYASAALPKDVLSALTIVPLK